MEGIAIVTPQDADKVRMIIQGLKLVRDRMKKHKSVLPSTAEAKPLHDYYREKVQDADHEIGRHQAALDTFEEINCKTVGHG